MNVFTNPLVGFRLDVTGVHALLGVVSSNDRQR